MQTPKIGGRYKRHADGTITSVAQASTRNKPTSKPPPPRIDRPVDEVPEKPTKEGE
ncbi:MAG: hypothetical protein LBE21_04860 [Pseudomonadales bacterium]|jgi:hypothetical protein|nr:hypothetical protein [Pseudomonadales bacterium]